MECSLHKEFENLCYLIERHDVISFDIYDTALLRNVLFPTDLFDVIASQMNLKDFRKIRMEAEELARRQTEEEDITLEQIYRNITKVFGLDMSGLLQEKELSIETEFTITNEFILSAFNYAKSLGKKIIFISDMYLPFSFISKLLLNKGFSFDEGHLFISGEVGLTKATTNIYSHIRQVLKIEEPTSWLHIGDNYKSDYINARKSGMNAYYYKNVRERANLKARYAYSTEMSIIKAIQINYCGTTVGLDYWQRFGINIVSSLYFGFTNWLADELAGKDNVFFLARDGYLPYKLFEKLAKVKDDLPSARYLYASRRTYQIPNLLNIKQQDALELLTSSNSTLGQKLTLGEIFDNLGLEKHNYRKIIVEYGFNSFDDIIDLEQKRSRAKKVLLAIYDDIEQVLKEQKKILIEYLMQNQVFEYKRVNIVDIGWRGSTQKALQDLTGIPTEGYYLGTAYNVYDDIKESVHGFAFNLGKPFSISKKIMDNVMMYEFIFSATHGTLIGFTKEHQQVKPVLKNENSISSYTSDSLNIIQSSVLSITDRFLEYYQFLKRIKVEDTLLDYFDFIKEKKYDDLVAFSAITANVGIGNTEIFQQYVTSVSVEDYLKNKSKIEESANKNLWKGALIVKGSSVEFNKRKLLSIKSKLWLFFKSYFSKEKMVKAVKNPRKVFRYIIRK